VNPLDWTKPRKLEVTQRETLQSPLDPLFSKDTCTVSNLTSSTVSRLTSSKGDPNFNPGTAPATSKDCLDNFHSKPSCCLPQKQCRKTTAKAPTSDQANSFEPQNENQALKALEAGVTNHTVTRPRS